MTAVMTADAVSHNPISWHAIDWQNTHENVRRLQARIVKAAQAGKWRKVKSLQRLLTHSFSGKALAVKRVTENQGKRTPGVDGEIWDTPAKKAAAIQSLRQHGYRPQPLRRLYIPKSSDKAKKRPLGIPTMKDRAMQALYLLDNMRNKESEYKLQNCFVPEISISHVIYWLWTPSRKPKLTPIPMASERNAPGPMLLNNASSY